MPPSPAEVFQEKVYRTLRDFEDRKIEKKGVSVGCLSQEATVVYDTIIASFTTALLAYAPKPPQSITVHRGEKFQINVAGPYQGIADPVGIIGGESYDCQINENGDLVISSWEGTVLPS